MCTNSSATQQHRIDTSGRSLRDLCHLSIPVHFQITFHLAEQSAGTVACLGPRADGDPLITIPPFRRFGLRVRALWHQDSAAQLVEFAVTLPLLVVFVVGIFDFSGAFTLKQK